MSELAIWIYLGVSTLIGVVTALLAYIRGLNEYGLLKGGTIGMVAAFFMGLIFGLVWPLIWLLYYLKVITPYKLY